MESKLPIQEIIMLRTATILVGTLAFSGAASAHCDTTQGPVVTAAREALDAGDADLVLHWVRPEDEPLVRSAFDHTMGVRALGPEAQDLADHYFFETLVRIHRAGEGAPYTGLSEGEPEPIIAATDRALEQGSTEELERQLVGEVRTGLANRFAVADAAKDFEPGDIAGGRAFVAAYVPLTHWVDGVFQAAGGAAEHHAAAPTHDGAHAGVHASGDPGAGTSDAHASSGHATAPWIVAGALAIVALLEGAFLTLRKRPVRA
jgi:hypothetical protein